MKEEDIAKLWKKMAKEEQDRHRKALHGSSKAYRQGINLDF